MSVQRGKTSWGRRSIDRSESHQAQLLWTFCVAIAVALAALYQMSSPKSALLRPVEMVERPSLKPGQTIQASQPNQERERMPAAALIPKK